MKRKALCVVLEVDEGRLVPVALELLGKARELADHAQQEWEVTACLLGKGVHALAGDAIECGADRVVVADHPALDPYTTTPHTAVVERIMKEHTPEVLLVGASHNGRDLAGRLAVRLRTGLTADCTDLELDTGSGLLKGWVVGFGGGIAACIVCPKHQPQMFTVRPGVFAAPVPKKRKGEVIRLAVETWLQPGPERVISRSRREGKDLSKAPVMVIGGRGVQGRFDLLESLKTRLGDKAEVGATRVAVDAGWISREHMIGQTGVVVRPQLAIVFGASGATHFTVGIDKAEIIISVNQDPEAPIFEQSDYVVVGDALKLIPALLERMGSGASL